jgi:hypothetical protein
MLADGRRSARARHIATEGGGISSIRSDVHEIIVRSGGRALDGGEDRCSIASKQVAPDPALRIAATALGRAEEALNLRR